MDEKMFCFQCEQAANGCACVGNAGVCGKSAETADAQDALTGALIGFAELLVELGQPIQPPQALLLLEGLFTTITNVNFDPETVRQLTEKVWEAKNAAFATACPAPAPVGDYDMKQLWQEPDEDIRSLKSTVLFGLRGKLVDNRLMSLTKINLPLIRDIPFIGRVLENLTIIDYLSYIIAVILFVYLYKTVAGFRTLSVGINKAAAESLGTKATRIQMEMVILSGALCGLGGVVLSMGQVTMFTENMTSGRGFIAMAAASLGMSHPLLVIAASLFFGLCQGIGLAIQNVVKSQLTNTLPYIATIVALVIFSKRSGTKLKG